MTVFLRLLEFSAESKGTVLLGAIVALRSPKQDQTSQLIVFERAPEAFSAVRGSPFAYWASDAIRSIFTSLPSYATSGRTAGIGVQTNDDFRFVRLWWEVHPSQDWPPLARGGRHGAFYGDVSTALNWKSSGYELKSSIAQRYGSASRHIQKEDLYGTPGLTWPLRSSRLQATALPAGSIFSMAGKAAFAARSELPALLALFNSRVFDYLLCLRAGKVGGVQYESGLIQSVPTPELPTENRDRLAALADRAYALKRALDTTNETSHAFLLPPILNERVTNLDRASNLDALDSVQSDIDEEAFRLYEILPEDRTAIETSPNRAVAGDDVLPHSDDDDDNDDATVDDSRATETADMLVSWLVGVAFARFDPRLATGERPIPPEPEPFDPLPARSLGMWPEGEEPVDGPDILVDDEGHSDDLVAGVTNVAENVGCELRPDLRRWLARGFFSLHIRMYSKSRRKAPIYWQLATPSASYSVWLYIHAFTKDTLYRVQNDYVVPKLAHEERKLESMMRERDKATAQERKQLANQEVFVEELRGFLDEVRRVAPLWNPDLDDGVIINFAPLWRLVPHHKPWQKELKATWDALCEGEYDWAHLAMHLWPERVVPKCATDRSFAIAHGLEEVFWVEGAGGKWTARPTPTRSIEELVRERTSPAVNAALRSLLEAPPVTGSGRGRSAKGKGGTR